MIHPHQYHEITPARVWLDDEDHASSLAARTSLVGSKGMGAARIHFDSPCLAIHASNSAACRNVADGSGERAQAVSAPRRGTTIEAAAILGLSSRTIQD